jgi:indole-3-glycerol phosphate synthase/phosphoribosylanthranilate isomerase
VPQLKICGITDAAFAVEAARRGIDYLGLIFAEGSPRRVTVEQARQIVSAVRGDPLAGRGVPDAPRFVGVFVNHSAEEIVKIATSLALDVIQLHGNYGAEKVAALKEKGFEVWRLFVEQERDVPDAVLLDGRKGTQCGGTGVRADWSLVEPLKRAGRRVVLAGGIAVANIADAAATGADVIDVNSSLETAPGKKSLALLDELLGVWRVL